MEKILMTLALIDSSLVFAISGRVVFVSFKLVIGKRHITKHATPDTCCCGGPISHHGYHSNHQPVPEADWALQQLKDKNKY